MSQESVTPREALQRLGASTVEAIVRVLEMFAPGAVERGHVTVVPEGTSPFANLPDSGVTASISYIDGVTGGNVLVMSTAGARALAAAMGVPPEGGEDIPLTELELSAVGEAANQTLAAAAAAISVVLGQEVEISPPETRLLDGTPLEELYGLAPHAISTSFAVAGESFRLIQLVPGTFVVRMARAIDAASEDATAERFAFDADGAGEQHAGGESVQLTEALGDIWLRVWPELGRTSMPLRQALELPVGAVVELDRTADAPVDLFVNGLCFGRGELLITDDGEWAIRVLDLQKPSARTGAATARLT